MTRANYFTPLAKIPSIEITTTDQLNRSSTELWFPVSATGERVGPTFYSTSRRFSGTELEELQVAMKEAACSSDLFQRAVGVAVNYSVSDSNVVLREGGARQRWHDYVAKRVNGTLTHFASPKIRATISDEVAAAVEPFVPKWIFRQLRTETERWTNQVRGAVKGLTAAVRSAIAPKVQLAETLSGYRRENVDR